MELRLAKKAREAKGGGATADDSATAEVASSPTGSSDSRVAPLPTVLRSSSSPRPPVPVRLACVCASSSSILKY
jgi:hypothetical protein